MKLIFKIILSTLVYIQLLNIVFLPISKINLLLTNFESFFLLLIVQLFWFWLVCFLNNKIIFTKKNGLYFKYSDKFSIWVFKIFKSKKLPLYYFISTLFLIFMSNITGQKERNIFLEVFFNISGILALIFFLINKYKKQ